MAFLLLQFANAALAAASLGVHFLNPSLWDDQALIFSTLSGALLACLTAVALGFSLLFSGDFKWRRALIHLSLTLVFVALQGWLLYAAGRDIGILELIESRLG